jgi:CRISPR-associated protein Cas1
MAWRSVMVTRPARLRLEQRALAVDSEQGTVRVPLEDMSMLVIDQPQVNLTAQLLSACADQQIAVVTVGANHHPNGVLLPHIPHSRALKVMRAQLGMSVPRRKRLWRSVIQRKIRNQADVLERQGHASACGRLRALAQRVRSGDTGHAESQAAQVYFRALFPPGFSRTQARLHNAAMNYGYSIIRSVLARNLVIYGFLTAFGLHHDSEQNAFNLADDLLEPFRPILDAYVLRHFPLGTPERDLTREDKAVLVNVMHEDVSLHQVDGETILCTLLAAAEASVVSLSQRIADDGSLLALPGLPPLTTMTAADPEDE